MRGSLNIVSTFEQLSKEKKIEILSLMIEHLKKEEQSSKNNNAGIPIGIFNNDIISSLEAIVKFMREVLKLRFRDISKLLNRSGKTIWATYYNASKKMPSEFSELRNDIIIPFSVFADRRYSTLESLVAFLKNYGMTNHEIGVTLHLDDSTIWTIFDRAKNKKSAYEKYEKEE